MVSRTRRRPHRRIGRAAFATIASVTAVAAGTSDAVAQRTGSHIGHDATAKDSVTGIRMIAECYVKRSARKVRLWLDILPGDPAEEPLLQRDSPNMSPCLDNGVINFAGTAISFKAPVLRRPVGAVMARDLLVKIGKPLAPAANAEPWFAAKFAALKPDEPVDQLSLAMQDFGHCVAVTRWNDSLALIRADDASKEERAAVTAMLPFLNGCLASGSTIKVNRRTLREMIGEPVYHLLQGAAPTNEKH